MQIKAQELNGIFQIDRHTSAIRCLWLVFVSVSLSIVAIGAWMSQADVFVLSQNATLMYFEIVLVVFLFLAFPAVIIIFGVIKIHRKPGVYLKGVRFANKGVEIGILTLGVNSVPIKEIWEGEFLDNDVSGEWESKGKFFDTAIKIIIVLRRRPKTQNRFLLDRVTFCSRDTLLFQLLGHDIYSTQLNNLVAISQGSLHSLASYDGIHPDEILSFREKIAAIISVWKPSFLLTCTLKKISSLANLNNVMAFGLLGGVHKIDAVSNNGRESQEIIFDSLIRVNQGRNPIGPKDNVMER